MKFIEMTGRTLVALLRDDEMRPEDLRKAGVGEDSIVRINLQGDIELRLKDRWEVIGGLIGDFAHRIERQTGLRYA